MSTIFGRLVKCKYALKCIFKFFKNKLSLLKSCKLLKKSEKKTLIKEIIPNSFLI